MIMNVRLWISAATSAGVLFAAGCATLEGPEAYRTCVTAALTGALIGALAVDDEEDREEGALAGAALFSVGCAIYLHMSEQQVEQMNTGTGDFLRNAPSGQVAQGTLQLDGGTVGIEAGQAQPAVALLEDEQLQAAAVPQDRICRRVSRTADLESGTRLDGEHVYCLNEDGDYEAVTFDEFVVAST